MNKPTPNPNSLALNTIADPVAQYFPELENVTIHEKVALHLVVMLLHIKVERHNMNRQRLFVRNVRGHIDTTASSLAELLVNVLGKHRWNWWCVVKRENANVMFPIDELVKRECFNSTRRTVILLGEGPVEVQPIPGDGGCLFHALRIALSITDIDALELRSRVVDFVVTEGTTLINSSETLASSALENVRHLFNGARPSLEQYANIMRRPGTWGGFGEVQAAAFLYETCIEVYGPVQFRSRTTGYAKLRARVGPLGLGEEQIVRLLNANNHYEPID